MFDLIWFGQISVDFGRIIFKMNSENKLIFLNRKHMFKNSRHLFLEIQLGEIVVFYTMYAKNFWALVLQNLID